MPSAPSGLFLLKMEKNKLPKIALFLLTFFCLLSTLITGRTGLVISLLTIFVFIISELSVKNVLRYSIILLIFSLVDYVALFEKLTSKIAGFDIAYFINWSGAALTVKDNRSINELTSMPIPPITAKTILGTGEVVDSKYGGNSSGNDSGYIQTYYSLGLILAIFFYTVYFAFLTNEIRKSHKWALILPLLIMILIEYKEPFIFKYILPFFILTLILEEQKEYKRKQGLHSAEHAI